MSVNSTNVETENEKDEKDLNETTDYINKNDNKNRRLSEEKSLKTNIAKNYKNEKTNNTEIPNEYNNNQNDHDNFQEETEVFKIPDDLKKTLKITIFLTILGIFLIAIGLIKIIIGWGPINGHMILVLGCIIFIPGGYYSFQFLRAKFSKFEYIRKDILDSIPRL